MSIRLKDSMSATLSGNASTATALQTARTINGTSFNGSANITTANWGTARTLTIGSAGKSVNGSGNISWTLAEIGAAASSHTHNYAGSSSAGGAATSALTCTGNSATATTLQTARTINGTSFNGSANITTANWGTARTITIGNTAKSVNGSGNVSWSLTEIGAADSNHNHNNVYSDQYLNKNNYIRITVNGDANTYYPVLISLGHTSFPFATVSISRNYAWAAPNTWNTSTHKGGLTLTVRWSGDSAWGGNDKNLVVEEFNETYSTMVAGMTLSTNGLVVWLRGGGALYQIDSNYGKATSAVVHLTSYTAANGAVYSSRTNTSSVAAEITNKWSVRGGAVYDGGNRVYHAGNKPSKSDVGLGSVNNWGASSSISANSTSEYATTNMVAQVRAEKANASHTHNYAGSSSAGGAATSATVLTTARTINGTSFNGSANITTANWGTARTITIGNTAKSVNGSGNVSWSLAEIGGNTGITANTLAQRDSAGDITARLMKSTYANQTTISGAVAYRVNNGTDNYIRFCSDTTAIRNWLGAAASSHTHSYLPLSGGTVTSSDFAIKTTTTTDSSKYITFYDTSGKRRVLMSTGTGSGGFRIHTYNSSGTWVSNFVVDEDGAIHTGNGYIKSVSEIWGRVESINLNIKKGTGYQGGARFSWTGSPTIGGPRFQMVPMDNYDLRVGSPEMPIHVVYGRVGYVTTSDKNAKTNICYINDLDKTKEYETANFSTESLTKDDFYNFFKDDIKFASYDFKEANLENLETNLGFMAQDIAKTKVGSKIVIPPRETIKYHNEDGSIDEEPVENGMYSFSTTNFASATAIALQKAIEKIENLNAVIMNLNEKIRELDNTKNEMQN